MNTRHAYDSWAAQYDFDKNSTRDLEGVAFRTTLANLSCQNCLEIGCGTGKNTSWLAQKAEHVTAMDFSEEMLARAKGKIKSNRVNFIQAVITEDWPFGAANYDLVSFSLVLEHIANLDPIFKETARVLRPGGQVYIGELHPFKQYTGAKANFATETGRKEPDCFIHHVSDFTQAAKKQHLVLLDINEYFDQEDKSGVPRILTLLLGKPRL
ncbi:MAG: SAM-dependent methyltransferase [Adhaeribacter sp.]|nr:SAM-dependent methyltransferase [Adhaeribacter sp.]